MSDKLEAYNIEIRDQWIAKSLGVEYLALKQHNFFVATDEESRSLVVTFIPSTDPDFLIDLPGNDGKVIFRIENQ